MKTAKPFEIKRIGIKYFHEPDFILNRPNGAGDYVFIRFLAPAELTFHNEIHLAKAGNFIFLSPSLPYSISGHETGLKNDWIHFNGDNVETLLDHYSLPLNKMLPTKNTAFSREILEKIEVEKTEVISPYKNRLSEILFETLCIQLSRSMHYEHGIMLSKTKREHLEKFREIRITMIESPEKDWTITQLAELAYVSNSRFAVLYKEFFGISPLAELLNVRIEHAKWLLTNSTSSVNGIARECGFNNIYYFSRKFTEIVGCPPSKYYIFYTDHSK